ISADRIERPHYWEAKKVFQYIKVAPEDVMAGRIRIRNEYAFTSLRAFAAEWVLEEDGHAIGQGKLAGLDVAPRADTVVHIPIEALVVKPRSEYFLTVLFRLPAATSWADAGHVVAWDQMEVHAPSEVPALKVAGHATLEKQDGNIIASAGGTSLRVDGTTGWLASFKLAGTEILSAPLRPNFWRVPTDNDKGWIPALKQVGSKFENWREAAKNAKLQHLDSVQTEDGARVQANWTVTVGTETATEEVTYLLRGDGSLRIDATLDLHGNKAISELPRVGVQLAIPAEYSQIGWYGRGPQESYRDRKTGAAIGHYRTTVNEWITPYVRPQDNANRTDVRWIAFTNSSGSGLQVKGVNRPLGVTAWPYTAEDLENATHDYLLPHRNTITVNLDGFQIGVGGDTSWGLPVHDQYRLKDKGRYTFAFEIGPTNP
ncbi:MAG TPA: beta-galactosidase domain 4-containing protein, partial [Opitutaceae bacterium]|nr:beta-galactosidase domain 4-containing protein [Opitutaceae bacterium]